MKKLLTTILLILFVTLSFAQSLENSLIKNNPWGLWERCTEKQKTTISDLFDGKTRNEAVFSPNELTVYSAATMKQMYESDYYRKAVAIAWIRAIAGDQVPLVSQYTEKEKRILLINAYSKEYLHLLPNGDFVYFFHFAKPLEDRKYESGFVSFLFKDGEVISTPDYTLLANYEDASSDVVIANGGLFK